MIYLALTNCDTTPDGLEKHSFIPPSTQTAKLQSISRKDSKSIDLDFSRPVTVTSAYITPTPLNQDGTPSDIIDNSTAPVINVATSIEGTLVHLTLDTPTKLGEPYTLFITTKDSIFSTLPCAISFAGYNDHIPKLEITEIRTEYSRNSKYPQKSKVEFVELRVVQAGNLCGLQLYSANDGEKLCYTFPNVEVKKGEYITVHYRLLPSIEEQCIDELKGNLSLCNVQDCTDFSRDLWQRNANAAVFAKAQDVIVIKNTQDNTLLDGVIYCDTQANSEWKTTDIAHYAQKLYNSGLWAGSGEVKDAVAATGLTATRTLSKVGSHTPTRKTDWIVTKTSGATPGDKNCEEPYKP